MVVHPQTAKWNPRLRGCSGVAGERLPGLVQWWSNWFNAILSFGLKLKLVSLFWLGADSIPSKAEDIRPQTHFRLRKHLSWLRILADITEWPFVWPGGAAGRIHIARGLGWPSRGLAVGFHQLSFVRTLCFSLWEVERSLDEYFSPAKWKY